MTSLWALVGGFLALMVVPLAALWWLAVLAAWLGFFGFGWFGPWVTYVAEAAPPGRVGLTLGLALSINQIAIIGSPPLLGWLRDLSGSYTIDWGLLVVLLLLSLLATRRRPPSDAARR